MTAPPIPPAAPDGAAWLPANTPVVHRTIVLRALRDVGLLELPPGSNRSPTIDTYVTAVGSPIGSYWCAAAVAAWWRDAGATLPPQAAGATRTWLAWAKLTHRWTPTPLPGRAILYGTDGIPDHIGVVIRIDPLILTVEGNTSFSQYDRNGIGVDCHELTPELVPRVLGYIDPLPLP